MPAEIFFKNKKPDIVKLEAFGFIKSNDGWQYRTEIVNGQFSLNIIVSETGETTSKVLDKDFNEEYTLHLSSVAEGKFVGCVRSEYESVLQAIAEKCFTAEIFKQPQTKELIKYVRTTYGDELEYLWPKFTNNAVWRRKDNQKWYAVVLTVAKNKLGLTGDELMEIIDVRIAKEKLPELVDNQKYFAGYHMNKKSWLTICLDGSVSSKELKTRLDESYRLAAKK